MLYRSFRIIGWWCQLTFEYVIYFRRNTLNSKPHLIELSISCSVKPMPILPYELSIFIERHSMFECIYSIALICSRGLNPAVIYENSWIACQLCILVRFNIIGTSIFCASTGYCAKIFNNKYCPYSIMKTINYGGRRLVAISDYMHILV